MLSNYKIWIIEFVHVLKNPNTPTDPVPLSLPLPPGHQHLASLSQTNPPSVLGVLSPWLSMGLGKSHQRKDFVVFVKVFVLIALVQATLLGNAPTYEIIPYVSL
jgi:hypothetical protein